MSISCCFGTCWKSSTDPRDDSDVDEAEAVGESSGEPVAELLAVEGIDSAVSRRLRACCCWRAVVLILGDVRAIGIKERRTPQDGIGKPKSGKKRLGPINIHKEVRV